MLGRPRCRLYSHRAFPTSPPRLFSREYRLGGAPVAKRGCHAWDYPHFPAERRPCRQGKMRPWNGSGIGLNLSALERNRTADCSAGYPARPERRTALFPPPKKRKRERQLLGRPRCRLYSQHGAFPASPPHLFSREYRLGDAPAVKGRCHAWDYPHFPVERRPCRQGEMRPWNRAALA